MVRLFIVLLQSFEYSIHILYAFCNYCWKARSESTLNIPHSLTGAGVTGGCTLRLTFRGVSLVVKGTGKLLSQFLEFSFAFIVIYNTQREVIKNPHKMTMLKISQFKYSDFQQAGIFFPIRKKLKCYTCMYKLLFGSPRVKYKDHQ